MSKIWPSISPSVDVIIGSFWLHTWASRVNQELPKLERCDGFPTGRNSHAKGWDFDGLPKTAQPAGHSPPQWAAQTTHNCQEQGLQVPPLQTSSVPRSHLAGGAQMCVGAPRGVRANLKALMIKLDRRGGQIRPWPARKLQAWFHLKAEHSQLGSLALLSMSSTRVLPGTVGY